jgi:AraC-like DNA-binding protein
MGAKCGKDGRTCVEHGTRRDNDSRLLSMYRRSTVCVLNGLDIATNAAKCAGSATMTATTISQIVWPRPAIAGCIFCMIVRDTRGVALDQTQRFNFFPASPLCSVMWGLAGEWHLIDRPNQMERPWTGTRLPGLAFFGPQLGPLVSWNPGETYAITIAFYPDALSTMTGLDLSQFKERMASAEEVLPQPILELCRNFLDVARREGAEKGLSVLEDKIESMWADTRPAGTRPMTWIKDWSRSLVLKAMRTDLGRSSRQVARRVKSWTGVSQRDLLGLGHTEQLYAKLHEAIQNGDVDWSGLAAASGFADQAHMIRQMRRHTGFTPEQLRQSARNDEAFWGYRLLGEYFTKPKGQ